MKDDFCAEWHGSGSPADWPVIGLAVDELNDGSGAREFEMIAGAQIET